jgi:hypothetical protein
VRACADLQARDPVPPRLYAARAADAALCSRAAAPPCRRLLPMRTVALALAPPFGTHIISPSPRILANCAPSPSGCLERAGGDRGRYGPYILRPSPVHRRHRACVRGACAAGRHRRLPHQGKSRPPRHSRVLLLQRQRRQFVGRSGSAAAGPGRARQQKASIRVRNWHASACDCGGLREPWGMAAISAAPCKRRQSLSPARVEPAGHASAPRGPAAHQRPHPQGAGGGLLGADGGQHCG